MNFYFTIHKFNSISLEYDQLRHKQFHFVQIAALKCFHVYNEVCRQKMIAQNNEISKFDRIFDQHINNIN